MASQAPLSPTGRILIGLFCCACGAPAALAAFDLGPFHASDINGPPWLGLLAGGVFIAAGISVMLGERLRGSVISYGLFALIFGSFAAIASWIAFGPGPRECAIAIAGIFFRADSIANEIACRAGFGIGAGMLDGVVLMMAAAALRNIVGPGVLATVIDKAGVALLVLSLAPFIVPMLLYIFGKIFVESVATWRSTGRWPRNEAFIARMKAKRARQL
ncbi:MAG: hypothetical protein R3D05_06615 [Dongiaceae bacterium]